MNLLPFYMFLEATGMMSVYQANMKLLAQMFQPVKVPPK